MRGGVCQRANVIVYVYVYIYVYFSRTHTHTRTHARTYTHTSLCAEMWRASCRGKGVCESLLPVWVCLFCHISGLFCHSNGLLLSDGRGISICPSMYLSIHAYIPTYTHAYIHAWDRQTRNAACLNPKRKPQTKPDALSRLASSR